MRLPRVPRLAWGAWALLGAALEGIALANRAEGDTLSALIVLFVPAWLGAGLLGWLAWHFGIGWVHRYLRGRPPRMR